MRCWQRMGTGKRSTRILKRIWVSLNRFRRRSHTRDAKMLSPLEAQLQPAGTIRRQLLQPQSRPRALQRPAAAAEADRRTRVCETLPRGRCRIPFVRLAVRRPESALRARDYFRAKRAKLRLELLSRAHQYSVPGVGEEDEAFWEEGAP